MELTRNRASAEARLELLRLAMRPADVTDGWQISTPFDAAAVQGLTRIELDHAQDEAQAIALMMRHTLETPDNTAILVTPDRGLAERVSAALGRWNIVVNDSAGASLATQPVGAFLRDLITAAKPDSGAVAMLSLLKHPFTACGLSPAVCRAQARQLEIAVWRTAQPQPAPWLDELRRKLALFTDGWNQKQPLAVWIDRHVILAETWAQSDSDSGAERLWRDGAGEAAAEWCNEWRRASQGFPAVTGDEYDLLFNNLLRGVSFRSPHGQHPRLNILGLLEARLIQADVTILGGLNEGVWPSEPPVDPWMSRPMKKAFGLASPERRIGQSAHDFVQLASGTEVILTRARRVGNAPAVPSRFLLQLDTVLRAVGLSTKDHDALASTLPWQDWVRQVDEPEAPVIIAAPEPRPSVHVRPRKLSVTEIGTWRRNPYAIYAKHILKLCALDPLDADIDASDRGIMIHAALDRFVKTCPALAPDQALEKLLTIGREVFAPVMNQPEIVAFWWPRFEKIAGWFVAHEAERRAAGIALAQAEASGKTQVGDFTLHGRADRIDLLPNRTLAIIDYKTGGTPSEKAVLSGNEPQLPLLALIAQRGGFDGIPAAVVEEIAYWKLTGTRDIEGEVKVNFDNTGLIADVCADLEQLITAFGDGAMPYRVAPIPGLAPKYDDYAHLARLSEWGRTESGDS